MNRVKVKSDERLTNLVGCRTDNDSLRNSISSLHDDVCQREKWRHHNSSNHQCDRDEHTAPREPRATKATATGREPTLV